MLARIYSDTLHLPVSISTELERSPLAKLLYGLPQDSVFKVMMQESDNFLAEQLLLQVSAALTDTLNSTMGIDSLQHHLSKFLPDSVIWVDGSGLSRYNMTTPRNIVMLWNELIKMFGQERLMKIISIGGVAGTIENWYAEEQPYIYGKTGTLRHNHVLSGMLITKSGRLLLFSYMNNHYQSSSSVVKQNMEQVLHKIYEKY
jgi:D-alanyl-D-alanine carboxypeptidase/D-alanyl-D-alanine-endopeptidase (penicillin-binding protein 4)